MISGEKSCAHVCGKLEFVTALLNHTALLLELPDRAAGYNGTVPQKGPFLSLTRVMKRCLEGGF